MGGFVGTVLNTPFDVVKTRIQNQGKSSSAAVAKYAWTLPALVTVAKEEGCVKYRLGANLSIGLENGTVCNKKMGRVTVNLSKGCYRGRSTDARRPLSFSRRYSIAALWKGFVPKVLRLGPGGGILYLVFDGVSTLMRKYIPEGK